MTPFILDTDPGIDDAMAFYYAHACEQLDMIALTTVFGNVTIEHSTKNALWLGESVEENIPVYQGTGVPLSIKPNGATTYVHGENGLGDVPIQTPNGKKQDLSATQFLVKEAAERQGELIVCAVGPLTNIALALDEDPKFIDNLKQLVIMGGSLRDGGNVTDFAEANFWNDPHAANKVLTAPGHGEIVIVGLDVTRRIAFTPQDYQDLADGSSNAGAIINDISQFYMDFYQSVYGERKAFLHDPAAVVACEKAELFEIETLPLSVVCEGEKIGAMVTDGTSPRTCKVCTKVNAPALIERYKQAITSLD